MTTLTFRFRVISRKGVAPYMPSSVAVTAVSESYFLLNNQQSDPKPVPASSIVPPSSKCVPSHLYI